MIEIQVPAATAYTVDHVIDDWLPAMVIDPKLWAWLEDRAGVMESHWDHNMANGGDCIIGIRDREIAILFKLTWL
jgi:hypothetical protein